MTIAAIAVQQVCTAVYLWVVFCLSEQLAVTVTKLYSSADCKEAL